MVALGLPAARASWIGAARDMSNGEFFALALLGLFAVIAVIAIINRKAIVHDLRLRSRRSGSRAFLRERGWNVVRMGSIVWTRPLAMPPLSGTPVLSVTDFAWGLSDGVVCAAFLAYPPEQQALAIEMADLPRPLPPLRLYPAVVDASLTTPLSPRAFVSESADFNARWVVRAHDARYASAILTPRFMDRLLEEDASDMMLVIDGGALITMTNGGAVPNDRIAAHLAVLRDLVASIPLATYSDFATGAPGNSWGWAPAVAPGTWTLG